MWWSQLIHIGDLPLTLAAAAAIAAWMLAARAWRLAFWWSLLFGLGIAVVAASKVAFLVWGATPSEFAFRTLSGHATGVTAVSTILLYLIVRHRQEGLRKAAIVAGLVLGAAMVAMLVFHDEHSVAEAAAGWVIGALVSVGGIALAGEIPERRVHHGLLWSSAVFVSTVILLRQLPIGYLMWRAARLVAHHAGAIAIAGQ